MSNINYERNDDNCDPVVPQPASTPGTPDPGSGWVTQTYVNFNGDYVARDKDNNPRTPESYRRSGEFGQELPVGVYIRHSAQNDAVVPPAPLVPGLPGTIYAPDGLFVGNLVTGNVSQYTGGTPPIIVESQLQRRVSGGTWETVLDWSPQLTGSRILVADDVGKSYRINTRFTDRISGPFIVAGTQSAFVQA